MISTTTQKLIDYSKQLDTEFDIESIRQFLIPDYHYEMTTRDVMSILLGALEEVIDEPRFEILYGKRIWTRIIMSTMDFNWGEPMVRSVEDVYEKYCREIMFAFRFTRRDWYEQTKET